MASILVPILYVFSLVGALYIFSRFYRRSQAARLQKDPWWPTHPERDLYITLLQQTDPAAPEYLLKAALIHRAITDIKRLQAIREGKQAATALVQKGSLGDDLLTRLTKAEKELQAELLEVVAEANSFKQGWGQYIFANASEMIVNEKTRESFESLPKIKLDLTAKYDRRKKFGVVESDPPENLSVAENSTSTPGLHASSPATATTTDSEDVNTPQTPNSKNKRSKKRK
ncbi:hypothetical protein Clacol_006330 [Clathrus columnatus]|uniref:Translocation protein SEC66 n=1 Tax=Clathrus columnatus TaxID=1419009 RepID=A0AAV5ABT9_9AGAM|nr:hypothetical protein Clacol_006330 [Clathrus columnatus]